MPYFRAGGSLPQVVERLTISPAGIGASATVSTNISCRGINKDMVVKAALPDLDAGLVHIDTQILSAHNLRVDIMNNTATSVGPTAAQVIHIIAF